MYESNPLNHPLVIKIVCYMVLIVNSHDAHKEIGSSETLDFELPY